PPIWRPPRQRSAAPKRPEPGRRLRIRCTARSASPKSTCCIGLRCAHSAGATISATRVIGRSSSATGSANAAPTSFGRWSPPANHGYGRDRSMSSDLSFDPIRLPESCQILRREARAFLADEINKGTFDPANPRRSEDSANAQEFAKRVAARGWIGMTWPKKYGGRERSFLERYVLTEEFRVVNAPTRVYFTADRQSGPTIIRYGTEKIKQDRKSTRLNSSHLVISYAV